MKDIIEIFTPLNLRLAEFETTDFPVSIGAEEYKGLLIPIKQYMGLIDNKEMLKKAKFLNDRVIEIFITLSNREHEYKKETTWRSELSYYFLTLEKIQEHLVQFSKVYKDSNKKEEFIDFVLTPAVSSPLFSATFS